MKEIEKKFDNNINVIESDRREQKAQKAFLSAIKANEKSPRGEVPKSLSMRASNGQTFYESNNQLDDSLLSSRPNIQRKSPNSKDFLESQNIRIPPHFHSTDDKMKIVHSIVKQKARETKNQ